VTVRKKPIRRASISAGKRRGGAAISLSRFAVSAEKLVYIAVANKAVTYGKSKSHIIYIGQTKKGVTRISQSAAAIAQRALKMHGVIAVDFFVYTCNPRQRVKMWTKLESALILAFKEAHGEPPHFNKQGVGMEWNDEDRYFNKARLKAIIAKYDHRTYKRP
jgi:hypothetical protein